MPTPTAELRLTARDETQQAINSALSGLQRLQGGVEGLRGMFERSLGALGLGLGIQEIFRQTVEAERAQARLETVLKTTGYAAGLAAKDINELAESLKAASTFDDDDIKAGLIQLLRFRDIGGDTFRETARLAVDFAAAMNTDVAGAMQTVGKALLAPGEGMRALKDAGVQLSDSQIALAKTLADTGRIAEAQKIVIDALKGSVGGAAAGETSGLYGSTKDLTRSWDDMLKAVGRTNMSPAILAIEAVTKVVKALGDEADRVSAGNWTERLARAMVPFANNPLWGKPSSTALGNMGDTPGERARFLAAGVAAQEARRQQDVLDQMDRAGADYHEKYKENAARAAKEAARAAEAAAKQAAAEQKRLHDQALADAIDVMNRQLDAEEEFQRESSKAWDIYTQNVLDIRNKGIRDEAEWFGVTDLERFRDGSTGTRGWGGNFGTEIKDAKSDTEKLSDTARDLGLTFQSAFEDAVIAGKDLSAVLQGIEKDLLRVAARRLVTEPLVQAGSDLFSGAGSWIGSMFASAGGNVMTGSGPLALQRFAAGGIAHKPTLSLFGEGSTPEAYVPLPDGRSIPVTMSGAAAAPIINLSINVDASGSSGGQGGANPQAIAQAVGAEVRRILVQEMRPGGMLTKK